MQVHYYETPVELNGGGLARVWNEPILKSLVLITTLAVMLFVMTLAIFLVATRPATHFEPETSGGQSRGPAFAINYDLDESGIVSKERNGING